MKDKSTLKEAKPLYVKWNEDKAKAVTKFIAKLSNNKGIDKNILFK